MSTGKVNWVEKNGKKVLVADYRNLAGQDLMEVFNESYTTQKQAGSDVLLMVDFTGAKANSEIVNALKDAGKELDKDMKKVAAIGLAALHKIFYNGYIRFTGQGNKVKTFDRREEAFVWLTE